MSAQYACVERTMAERVLSCMMDAIKIAAWAQRSRDPLAQNDIRGLRTNGERWGANRSHSPATLCVLERWSERLDAARRFAEQEARAVAMADGGSDGPGPLLPGLGGLPL